MIAAIQSKYVPHSNRILHHCLYDNSVLFFKAIMQSLVFDGMV